MPNSFIWVLVIHIQVLIFEQQALYPRSHLLSHPGFCKVFRHKLFRVMEQPRVIQVQGHTFYHCVNITEALPWTIATVNFWRSWKNTLQNTDKKHNLVNTLHSRLFTVLIKGTCCTSMHMLRSVWLAAESVCLHQHYHLPSAEPYYVRVSPSNKGSALFGCLLCFAVSFFCMLRTSQVASHVPGKNSVMEPLSHVCSKNPSDPLSSFGTTVLKASATHWTMVTQWPAISDYRSKLLEKSETHKLNVLFQW